MHVSILTALAIVLPLATPLRAQEAGAEKIRVLIVSGANNHDWEWTSPSLEQILEESGRFEADITYKPGEFLADASRLRQYQALVLDYNGKRWGEVAEKNFLAAVEGGMGISIIHAANNAFPGWKEYETLVGHCWRKGTGHGRFHPFDVRIEDRDHPITRTMPDLRAHPDELYHRLMYMYEAQYKRLASAHSSKESGGTGADELMVTVLNYGQGRIFHTPLGHVWKNNEPSRASHADPQFRVLVQRGTEWAATGDVADGTQHANQLSEEDVQAGWISLFDGQSLDGWRGYDKDAPGDGWTVQSGCIRRAGEGGDLITARTFGDFELEFEFMLAAGANSGIKYRVVEEGPVLGPEYQVLDDSRHPKESAHHLTGALYDVVEPATDKTLLPPGRFNHARIVARGARLEHWLNGQLVAKTWVGSDDWKARKGRSKFKNKSGFAEPVEGHILLQDHGGEVWYRNMRLRDFSALADREVKMLDQAGGLSGWREVGDAGWSRNKRTIEGKVAGGGQSFLYFEQTFSDFIFEVDLKIEENGNSGIQFRSHINDAGRVHGYQAEIDPSKRSWSGGIFYEGGAWLDDLKDNPEGRAAFDREGWNRYRIQCVGDHLRVWLNGVPTADAHDGRDAEGFIAFQVHNGRKGHFKWRNPRLWDLSTR